ncbi:hypothetical protein [Pleomorphovibrio marinus]|uniref:hypothetical protein n=1 Tax=Pleomorphovibrio marinus TaxID=2164132 RepID=UPI000E0AC23B|nr:hypothetical protein [Pleomorphovibrio marinus]
MNFEAQTRRWKGILNCLIKKWFWCFVMLVSNIFLGCSLLEKQYEESKFDRVLVIGNSITHHPPNTEIKWYGDWGMAASEPSKDFFHTLSSSFQNLDNAVTLKRQNVFVFERGFDNPFIADEFEELREFAPDLLIIRLGENVPLERLETNNFSIALQDFVGFILDGRKEEVIITSTFWENSQMDTQLKHAAEERGWNYVPIGHLGSSDTYKAIGEFENEFVEIHPNDAGMAEIAALIWEEVKRIKGKK